MASGFTAQNFIPMRTLSSLLHLALLLCSMDYITYINQNTVKVISGQYDHVLLNVRMNNNLSNNPLQQNKLKSFLFSSYKIILVGCVNLQKVFA